MAELLKGRTAGMDSGLREGQPVRTSAWNRAARISSQLFPADTKGEEQHPISEESLSRQSFFRFKYQRQVVKVVVREQGSGGIADKYGGIPDVFVLEGELLLPNVSSSESKTVMVFMHPAATMNMLPMPVALARAGCHVLLCGSRYAGNDTCLIMEKCVKDLASYIKHCYENLGYDQVVLCGWSGGGSLSVFYQSQATIDPAARVKTPVDLTQAELPAADALIILAAHASRARILTECLDPSVHAFRYDDAAPVDTRALNLYSPDAASPPYSAEFLSKYHDAQKARSKRIDTWALQQVALGQPDAPFILDGTMADPRWLDPTIDPNDREPGVCYLGKPSVANNIGTGLARFCTAAGWLSQWSFAESNADAVAHIGNVQVPVLIIENGADDGCPVTHPREVYQACSVQDRQYYCVRDATHYYDGQPAKLLESCQVVVRWLVERSLVEIATKRPSTVNTEQELTRIRSKFDGSDAMQISSINHLALVSSDMERTCEFYGEVLGLRLSKTIALPGGGQHFFFALPDGNALAFFWFRNATGAVPGVSAPSLEQMLTTGQHPSANGSMNHVAFNVPEHKLKEYRKRIKSADVGFVSPILFHADTPEGYIANRESEAVSWVSFYFFGPDGELLELTSQTKTFEDVETHVAHIPRQALWRDLSDDDQ